MGQEYRRSDNRLPLRSILKGDSESKNRRKSVAPPDYAQTTVCETCSPTLVAFLIVFVLRSAEFLGESDEKSFRPADVAEPIRVFILDYFAYELRAAITKPFKRLVDVVHGEHDAEIA